MTLSDEAALPSAGIDDLEPGDGEMRILVIDDTEADVALIDHIFSMAAEPPASFSGVIGQPAGWGHRVLEVQRRRVLLDSVSDGPRGTERVFAARRQGRPYAVAFVDLRMPRWDGYTTINALWDADPDIQVVICTGYCDCTWSEVTARLGRSDRWLILKKPFEPIELLQMTWASADRWRLRQVQRNYADVLEHVVESQIAELQRTNRTLVMISHCNEALIRSATEAELLNQICQHIIQDGGYKLAWVGYPQADSGRILPVSFAGASDGYIESLQPTPIDGATCSAEQGSLPAATAIRETRPVASRQTAVIGARHGSEASLRQACAAILALPLRCRGDVLGCLSIHSNLPDAFDDAEVKLLAELADDLAYGVASLREAAAREKAERQLEYQANYDPLTGLPNRTLFRDRLRQAVVYATRAQRRVAALLLNLDRYQAIHDTLGEDAANALLQAAAERLQAGLRQGDSVARLTGAEFAIAVTDVANVEDMAGVAHQLLQAVARPVQAAGHDLLSTASIGISLSPNDGNDEDVLLRSAASALRSAQAEGGNTFRFYAPEMNERASLRLSLEAELHRALAERELMLHYQPKVSLRTGELAGAEALLRWRHPRRGLIPPADFIPQAEESGLIVPIGEWVIATVCAQIREWRDAGLGVLPVAVNVSPRQFRQKNLPAVLHGSLQANGLDPQLLELEITESLLMEDVAASSAQLGELKATGVKLTLDDFGTGYSSLSYLQRFPIDHVKIDRSFVRDVTHNPGDAAICCSIISLAHALQMRVIGEGIETEGQLSFLRRHHCDDIQGYYFCRPIPAAAFKEMLQHQPMLPLADTKSTTARTLLVVDDEPSILSALLRLFRREGFTVLTATNAREGLELLAKHEVQVILADHWMPHMTGTEFLARVRQLYPDTIRIILSGYIDLDTVINAVNQGTLFKFLTKPWDEEFLRAQLREAFLYHEVRQQWRQGAGA